MNFINRVKYPFLYKLNYSRPSYQINWVCTIIKLHSKNSIVNFINEIRKIFSKGKHSNANTNNNFNLFIILQHSRDLISLYHTFFFFSANRRPLSAIKMSKYQKINQNSWIQSKFRMNSIKNSEQTEGIIIFVGYKDAGNWYLTHSCL